MKISPEPLPEVAPVRARPREARRASRSSWCGSSGASVATTMMIEPSSLQHRRRPRTCAIGDFGADRHAGDPQLRAPAVIRLHEDADRVSAGAASSCATRCRCRP